VRAAVAEAETFATLGVGPGSSPVVVAPLRAPIWAAETVIGFPQSMQNREVVSFSRPQNEQTVNRHSPRPENLMGREYRKRIKPREGHGQKG
jgi:hypothetical protein